MGVAMKIKKIINDFLEEKARNKLEFDDDVVITKGIYKGFTGVYDDDAYIDHLGKDVAVILPDDPMYTKFLVEFRHLKKV